MEDRTDNIRMARRTYSRADPGPAATPKKSNRLKGKDMAETQNKASSLFRQKSLDRVSSPEQTDDYVRLPSASLWLVVAAAVLLAAGAMVWFTLGGF